MNDSLRETIHTRLFVRGYIDFTRGYSYKVIRMRGFSGINVTQGVWVVHESTVT